MKIQYLTQEITFLPEGDSKISRKKELLLTVAAARELHLAILYGSVTIDLVGMLHRPTTQNSLLFLPSCLRVSTSCLPASDALFKITNSGLNDLFLRFLDDTFVFGNMNSTSESQIMKQKLRVIWYT